MSYYIEGILLTKKHIFLQLQLIQQCIEGNRKAQAVFYNRYASSMLSLCRRYMQNKEEAEEVLMNGFVKIFKNLNTYTAEGNFEGWMKRIFINEALNYKKKFKLKWTKVDLMDSDATESFKDSEETEHLLKALQSIPKGYRTVFNLHVIEGYKHREIAEMLNISDNTLINTKQRIMKKLTLILIMLLPFQTMAAHSLPTDTIRIIVNGDVISIEADDPNEIKELLKHNIQQLFKTIYSNLNDENNSTGNAEIHMDLYLHGDSTSQEIHFESQVVENDSTSPHKTRKIISISNEGIHFEERMSESNQGVEEESKLFKIITELKSNIRDTHVDGEDHDEEEESNNRTFSMSEIRIGFNNYLNEDQKIPSGVNHNLKPITSLSVSYTKYAKTRIFAKGPLFLKYGLGLTSNNYKFSEPVQLIENESTIVFNENLEHEVKKSKFTTLFIDAPLMLQLDLSSDKKEEGGFNIAVGPYVGYLLKVKSKYVYTDANNNSNTDKQKGDFFVNKVRYGLQSQFGVLGLNFFAKYELSNLFEATKGPENLNVFGFGMVIDL